ncbi:MAG TPA: carbon-nitrogen hydrolase family protein [Pseudonocardia sp.]|nr:carbon-nitrogen hydrolase family protein [Pseudonocardia sp.]
MTVLTVAAAQLTSGADPAANLELVTDAIATAAARGARLLVTPEATMACFGTDLREVAEPLDGPWANAVRAAASEHGITAVVGMFEPAEDGRVHNTLLVAQPSRPLDEEPARYRKMHLFDAFGSRESAVVAPGAELVSIEVEGVSVGLATCYDVRFADQFTALGRAGAELIVLPASWGDGPGKAEQWDLLTRARAADAQAWLLASDQAWTAPRGRAPLGLGRSVLADPTGGVRARLGSEPGLLVAEIDTELVREVRERVPIL